MLSIEFELLDDSGVPDDASDLFFALVGVDLPAVLSRIFVFALRQPPFPLQLEFAVTGVLVSVEKPE